VYRIWSLNRRSKMKKFSWFLPLVSFALLGAVALAGPPGSGYHLIKKIALGAAPGGGEYFDYITVDSAARRVYLSHGTEVTVVDANSGSVVGKIPGLIRCHGVAIVSELGKGFITDGDAGKVIIFDLASLKVTGEAKADNDANAITYDPASKQVFSFNKDSKNVTVIDPAKGTAIETIPLGGNPDAAPADGKGMIYVNLEDTNEVVVLDTRALKIQSRWPVAPGGQPTSMAMDREHRRLFIGGRNPKTFFVINADNGKVIQSFPIGDRVDTTTFDPETGLIASATGDGAIHIFHEDSPDKYSLVETVKTEFGAKTMGLDLKTHNLYVDTSDFDPAPAPTKEDPHPRRKPIPGTFRMLIYGR
jgi:YVTN family beta-propeller protein